MDIELPLGIRISDTEYKIPVSQLSNLESIISQYKTYFKEKDVSIKEDYITISITNSKTERILELSRDILKSKIQLEKLGVEVNVELLNQEYVTELILKEALAM